MRLNAPRLLAGLLAGLLLPGAGRLAAQTAPLPMTPVEQSGDAVAHRAAGSVLRVFSFANPDAAAPAKHETARLPRLPLAALRFPLPVELRVAFQAEACRLNGLEWCPIFREESRGTAFAVERSGRFMTCRHIVQDWLYWVAAFNPGSQALNNLTPPLALADANGRLAFVSVAPGSGFRMSLLASSARLERPLAQLLRGDMFWDADFMQFDLADDLGVAPLRRRLSFQAGETIRLLGYPDRRLGGDAAPLIVSRGRVLEKQAVTLVTDARSAKGVSGAPMLDENGHVGGMTCSISRSRGPRGPRLALGIPVSPQELRARLAEVHGLGVTAR